MIVVAGFNSAIDKRFDIDVLTAGEVHRARSVVAAPGGKGLHVAQTIAALGGEVHLVGVIDQAHRDLFETVLRARGVTFHGIVAPAIRTCLAIRERDGRITELLEPGSLLDAAAVDGLMGTFRTLAARAKIAVLSGSVPPGCPEDVYASLVRDIQADGVRCLVDASGDALCAAIEARPYLIKPNREETAMLRGVSVVNRDDAAAAVQAFAVAGIKMPVVSMGELGALCPSDGDILHAIAPAVDVVNPVGSGDCMLGGIAYALSRGEAAAQALRLGVACGAANAASHDTGDAAAEYIAALSPRVEMRFFRLPVDPEPSTPNRARTSGAGEHRNEQT